MKLTITRDLLQSALADTNAAVPTRTALNVLTHVLLRADNGRLTVTATDLDVAIIRTVTADIETPGSIAVPAKRLMALVKELAAAPVKLSAERGTLRIASGRTQVRLNGVPADEFPNTAKIDYAAGFSVSGSVLSQMIGRTTFAVSTEESRPILNGVLWDLKPGEMRMVATNGHRLARNVTPVSEPLAPAVMIVPANALNQISRIFGNSTRIDVARSANHLGFTNGEVEVTTRLIEGDYPNYEAVIPKQNDRILVVDRQGFEQSIRRMAVLASDQTHRIVLSLSRGSVRFSVTSPDMGEASDEIVADYDGEPFEIGFNAAYLLEVTGKMGSDRIRLTFAAPERAALVMPEDEKRAEDEAPPFLAVVMPLRLLD